MIESLTGRVNALFPDDTTPAWPITLGRIAMGALWLFSLRWKLPPDFESTSQTGLREWLELEVEHAAFGFYGSLIETAVLPNFTVFAWLVFLSELLVGLALVVGLRIRWAALIGLIMSANLLVGLLEVPGEWPWAYLMMIMWHGTILVSNPTLWSLDGRKSSTSQSPLSLC